MALDEELAAIFDADPEFKEHLRLTLERVRRGEEPLVEDARSASAGTGSAMTKAEVHRMVDRLPDASVEGRRSPPAPYRRGTGGG